MIPETKQRTIHLQHPELGVPAIATETGHWRDAAGRTIGLILQFPDGERHLTYGEIHALRQSSVTYEYGEAAAGDCCMICRTAFRPGEVVKVYNGYRKVCVSAGECVYKLANRVASNCC